MELCPLKTHETAQMLALLASLALAAPGQAGTKWVGAQLQCPVPARDIGSREIGVDAGVTFTVMQNAYVGVGAELIHHYWPASAGYVGALDRYLRSTRFQTLAGSDYAFTAFQATGHVKLETPTGQRYAPWLQIGAGVYRLNRHLDEQRPAGTYAWVEGSGLGNISVVPGGYAGVGVDFHLSSAVALGLDTTFHYLWSGETGWSEVNLPDFSAVTVGARVLYGWQ